MHQLSVDNNHDYRDRYVAFLDILGFRSFVESAESKPKERARLQEVLNLMRDTLCQNPAIDMRFTHFSDCIVISIERTAQGLLEAFQSIDILTFNLLQFDVLLRGGLVAGGAYHGKDFVYGTAVNRAYELESKYALNPIVLVAPEVLEDARSYGHAFSAWLLEDSPGRHFIHYLRQYAEYRPEPVYPGKVILDEPAKRVIDFVCRRLNSSTGSVLAKAEWVREYWNRTVAVHGVLGSIESGVTEHYHSRGPTIMMRRVAGGG